MTQKTIIVKEPELKIQMDSLIESGWYVTFIIYLPRNEAYFVVMTHD